MGEDKQISVLAVCLGNICRSPMAEGVLAHLKKSNNLPVHVESAGTAGYHEGEEPDERTLATLYKHNISIDSTARRVRSSDFNNFDYILAMDGNNLQNLLRIKPSDCHAQVKLFGEYGDGKAIQDPYYGGTSGFEKTYQQCMQYGKGFYESLGYNVN